MYKTWQKVIMKEELMPRSRSDPVVKKLDNPLFHSIFTPELNTLAQLFRKYNYQLKLAGGAVRDILMDIKPADLDFATDATPEEMKIMFEKENIRMINNKGEKHGMLKYIPVLFVIIKMIHCNKIKSFHGNYFRYNYFKNK